MLAVCPGESPELATKAMRNRLLGRGTLSRQRRRRDIGVLAFLCPELIEDPADVVVTGVLLRELGRGADPEIYGDSSARVTYGPDGPERRFIHGRLWRI